MRKKTAKECEEAYHRYLFNLQPWVSVRGNLVHLHLPTEFKPHTWEHKRKGIGGFSPQSRLRMLKWSATVDWGKIPKALFVTLSYPDEFATATRTERSAHLDALIKRLDRHFKTQEGVIYRWEWKPRLTGEFVGRVSPHLHLLLLNKRYLLWYDLMAWWMEIIGEKTYANVDVRKANKRDMAARYMTKYLSKMGELGVLGIDTYAAVDGKHWGTRRHPAIPRCKETIWRGISQEQTWIFIRAAARAMAHFDWQYPTSFSLFGQEGLKAVKLFMKTNVDIHEVSGYDQL